MLNEFKQLVKECHKRGIEVILDVVFNHTAEGNEKGPTLSFRQAAAPPHAVVPGFPAAASACPRPQRVRMPFRRSMPPGHPHPTTHTAHDWARGEGLRVSQPLGPRGVHPRHHPHSPTNPSSPTPPHIHPTCRGLDNRVYYMLAPGGQCYNYSGCGNTFNCNHPVARQFIVDCLRYWVEEMHVDGFRWGGTAASPKHAWAVCRGAQL